MQKTALGKKRAFSPVGEKARFPGPRPWRDKGVGLLFLRAADHPGDFGQGEGAAIADQGHRLSIVIDDAVGDHGVLRVGVGDSVLKIRGAGERAGWWKFFGWCAGSRFASGF